MSRYKAKERKRRKYEGRSGDGRHQAIAQLSALLEVIRRKQHGKH
ncbi:hypothetical protein [Leptolyngbya sp. FACHB-36]|nr:hypothetical protein [Leptolyngbya sp. FACHB-36]